MIRQPVMLLVLALALVYIIVASPAYAVDLERGKEVFEANCISCHWEGRNIVNPQKSLAKADLKAYGMYSSEAIINQIIHGKDAMPAFNHLSDEDIENVAAYVLTQADTGWPQLRKGKQKHCRHHSCLERKDHVSWDGYGKESRQRR
jgi:cytochrome c6